MAFSFKKPGGETAAKEPAQESAEAEPKKSGFAGFGSKKKEEAAPKQDAGSFLKTGAAAKAMFEKHEAEVAASRERRNRAWTFYMKSGEDAVITFLDGQLDANTGILAVPFVNTHRVKIGDRFEDVVCIEDQEPCPICAAGEYKSFVGLLTVLDHRGYEGKDKDGKEIKLAAIRRLYAAKTETLKMLTKIAEKNDGNLAGISFEVSRTGDKKPAVGDLFEKVAQHSYEEIAGEFGEDFATPLDYAKELLVLSAAEMANLGIGKKVSSFGGKSGGGGFGKGSTMTFGKKSGSNADDIDDNKKPW